LQCSHRRGLRELKKQAVPVGAHAGREDWSKEAEN
jgi:hypothetical protein